jgi:WD40 repeat protein
VSALAWSADGKTLATSGAGDDSILLWEAASGKMLRRLSVPEIPSPYLHFTADGKTLLSYGNDRALRTWDVAEGKERSSFAPTPVQPNAVAFSSDGKLAAFLGSDRKVRVWDTVSEKELHQWEVKPKKTGGDVIPGNLVFAADNRTLLAYSLNERVLRRWDVGTGREMGEITELNINAVSFVPQREQFCDGWGCALSQGRTASLIELATGKPRLVLTLPPPAAPVPGGSLRFEHVVLSPDGRTIATILSDRTLRLWDTGSGKVLAERKNLPTFQNLVVFSPDGKTLATGGSSCDTLLWDVPGPAAEGRLVVKDMTTDKVAALWDNLLGEDAGAAWQAIRSLAAAPKEALPFIQKHLKPQPPPDDKQIAQWIADLNDDEFQKREDASAALVRAGRVVEPAVGKALEKPPSAEVKQRLQAVLAKLSAQQGPSREAIRALRTIELLERIGTTDAQKLLEDVARRPDGSTTAAARAAMERIKSHSSMP